MFRSFKLPLLVLSLCLGGLPAFLLGTGFYVDPIHGSMDGDGSAERPWRTLQEVVEAGLIETRKAASIPHREGGGLVPVNPGAPIQPGDTVYLRTGYHGVWRITGAYNARPITVRAEAGHRPQLRSVFLRAASNWRISGLSISPSHAPEYVKTALVNIDNHRRDGASFDILIEDCDLFSVDDISGWTAEDWRKNASSAFVVDGDRCRIIGNRIRNVRFGIHALGDEMLVAGNRITNFSADGIRGLGDYSVYENNIVENAFKVDDNHDDAFQSWSVGEHGVGSGEVRGVVLRGNVFINSRDPEQPLLASLQGIGCFDGMYVGWIVENNVISVNHWHGITFMGAVDCRIANNTVIDMYDRRPGPSWIRVSDHKKGKASSGNLVSNNLANSFSLKKAGTESVANMTVENPRRYFMDPEQYDFRLKPKSPAIDKADAATATPIDIDGRSRTKKPDVGAYEFRAEGDAGAQPPL